MNDETMPKGKWEFDADVTAVFDDMLERSIPQYEVMRQLVFSLGSRYVSPDTWIIDLGCSRGEALAPYVGAFLNSNHYLGLDVSEPMRLAARMRFHGNERVIIRDTDLRIAFPSEQSSLTLCILTLQFTPIEYRQKIMQNIYDKLLPGGALIIVEKVLGSTAAINEVMVAIYHALKGANGYTEEQIERKRLSLEGVLVPVTADWNVELMRMAGFRQIDCFWRWMNFAGWIAVKGE